MTKRFGEGKRLRSKMRLFVGEFCLLVLLLSSFFGFANVRVSSAQDQDQKVPAPQIQTETKANGYRGAYDLMVQHGPDFGGSWGVGEDSDPDNGLNVGWCGNIGFNVSGTPFMFQYSLSSFRKSLYSGVYINCSDERIPIYLYNCSSFDMVTSNVTYVGNVPTFTNTITFHDIQLETYDQGDSSVTLVFTQHFTADWTLLTVKTDVFADLTHLKLYKSNGTLVPVNMSFLLNFDYLVCLINQTSSGTGTVFILPSEITPTAVYFNVNGAGGMQYSLADMTLGDVYDELQGNTQVAGKTATVYFTPGWEVGCTCIQTFSDLTYGLTIGIESDPTIHVQHTRVPVYWGTTSTPTTTPSPSPSPSLSPTPSASQQPTSSPEPSTTSISSTEIVLITVTVVIAVSVAALAISKRHKR